MSEGLRGNLAQLPLLDILSLLSSRRQTGRLELKDGTQAGEIYLVDGDLTHAEVGSHLGEDAIDTVMGWLQGDFKFVPGANGPEVSLTSATEQILLDGARRVNEWGDIKKLIPSTDTVFKLSADGSPSTVNLEPSEWKVLTHVNGSRTLAEIAAEMGRDELSVAKVLYGLSTAGLLIKGEKPATPPEAAVSEAFFASLKDEVLDILGPLGPMVIEEAVESLGEDVGSFPREKVASLVEQVSSEIDDEAVKAAFHQTMLKVIKKM